MALNAGNFYYYIPGSPPSMMMLLDQFHSLLVCGGEQHYISLTTPLRFSKAPVQNQTTRYLPAIVEGGLRLLGVAQTLLATMIGLT
jgi:hypothetical protein